MKAAIIMGSDSDWSVLEPAAQLLAKFGVDTEITVASAHRTPAKVQAFASQAAARGVRVIIAGAGAAAALPGVVASFTTLPVIGVPINSTPLNGMDALLSIVQMPSGMPVATMAVNGAKNAALLAVQILAIADNQLQDKLVQYRQQMAQEVETKEQRLLAKINQNGEA